VKVKELIRLLQEEDPEAEACVHNADIESVYAAQAYWDGRLQVLERDAEGYVVGGKYTSNGWKVNISRRLSLSKSGATQSSRSITVSLAAPQRDTSSPTTRRGRHRVMS